MSKEPEPEDVKKEILDFLKIIKVLIIALPFLVVGFFLWCLRERGE